MLTAVSPHIRLSVESLFEGVEALVGVVAQLHQNAEDHWEKIPEDVKECREIDRHQWSPPFGQSALCRMASGLREEIASHRSHWKCFPQNCGAWPGSFVQNGNSVMSWWVDASSLTAVVVECDMVVLP